MQTGSSSDDWRLQGIKLFNERQFDMATMCFEKAGDTYREMWARAAGLLATGDRVMSTNLEMGKASLQKASEIYESIGMHEKAATCYIRLGDYERAGIAKHKGNVLLEVDMSDKAESRGIIHMAQSIRSLLQFFFPSSVDKLDSPSGLAHGQAPVLLDSGTDGNAIMSIFGENKSEHGSLHGFGAEQVILVRDVATKKYIVDLVGKQALVFTIVECKGLEFQDVLLYNFFSSSPLRNKWSHVYYYMKEKDIIAPSEEIPHVGLGRSKPNLLCSELKQLYVAITRSRQRLWICEDTNDYSRPIFDYWKKLRLIEVRSLDFTLIQEMQSGSSTDDWRLQGTKLFNEGQFEMATVCFEKAGDTYREKLARAAGLLATADRVISTNLEMGQASLQNASDIYESIGMYDKVATCYIKLGDYEAAGTVYMQKCDTSKLEDAGNCYAMAECWLQAAEAYFKAKCYTQCFSMCLKGKLFTLGSQFLQSLEEECLVENSKSLEVSAIRKMYLENCAQYFFEHGDIQNMMSFVKAFSSPDHVRAFLSSRNIADELLRFVIETGKLPEAAGKEKDEADVTRESLASQFTDAIEFVVNRLVIHSLWSSNSTMRSWSSKTTSEKNQFCAKANDMVKEVKVCYSSFHNFGACILEGLPKSLPILSCAFRAGRECGNLVVELVAARLVLDVHLEAQASGYNLGLAQGSEEESCCDAMLACDQISPETLLYVWNHWRSIIVKVLSHLRHPDSQESNDCAVTYDDLCARYFGLRKDGDNGRYVVNMNSSWFSDLGRSSLQQDGKICWLDSIQFHSFVQNFWMNELSLVSLTVLNKLSGVHFSPKQASSYAFGRNILIMYEIAMFLKESEFSLPKSTELRSLFVKCERRFFEFIYHVWRDGTVKPLLSILESQTTYGLITDSLGTYLRPANKKLTHGHLGRVAMFLLHVGRCTSRQSEEMLFSRLLLHLDKESEWAKFFLSLKIFIYAGGFLGRSPLILNFKLALEFTFNANWMTEPDYISPVCYTDLIEFLGLFASSYSLLKCCVYCTKSILVKMLKCCTSTTYLFIPSSDLVSDEIPLSAGHFIFQSVRKLLSNKCMIQEWFQKTSTSTNLYIPVLERLVITLCVVTLNLKVGDCYEVTDFLRMHNVFEDLPLGFSQKILYSLQISSRTLSNFRMVFADALAAIGNRMVVMTPNKVRPIFRDLNADIISRSDWQDIEKVLGRFSPEDSNLASNENVPFWEKYEAFRVNKHPQKDAWIIIQFIRSALSWLERSDPPKKMDRRLLEEVRHICHEFEERSARMGKRACDTARDLYAMWEDGENKLRKVMRYLHSEKASMKKDAAAAVAQQQAGGSGESSGCSYKEADTGGNDTVELAKEDATVAQASKQKQQSKKKPKKSKRHSKK